MTVMNEPERFARAHSIACAGGANAGPTNENPPRRGAGVRGLSLESERRGLVENLEVDSAVLGAALGCGIRGNRIALALAHRLDPTGSDTAAHEIVAD